MYFTRILLSIVFALFASTVLAAKPGKTLVCHVGNERGPEGQVYDPDCVPDDSYDCSADAGKVDLILVSEKAAAKHIVEEGEDAIHSFVDGTGYEWVDYSPGEGVGNDPADFEEGDVIGIDKGCELAKLSCPCWNTYTYDELLLTFNTYLSSSIDRTCSVSPTYAGATARDPEDYWGNYLTIQADSEDESFTVCGIRVGTHANSTYLDVSKETAEVCVSEAQNLITQITWCPQP